MPQVQQIESDPFRFVNGGGQCVRVARRAVEDAMLAVDDDVTDAAGAERHDRSAAGERLDGGDAEVLDARLHEAAGAAVELAQLVVGDAPEDSDVSAAGGEAMLLGPAADDAERQPELGAGGDGEVEALVGDR